MQAKGRLRREPLELPVVDVRGRPEETYVAFEFKQLPLTRLELVMDLFDPR